MNPVIVLTTVPSLEVGEQSADFLVAFDEQLELTAQAGSHRRS